MPCRTQEKIKILCKILFSSKMRLHTRELPQRKYERHCPKKVLLLKIENDTIFPVI